MPVRKSKAKKVAEPVVDPAVEKEVKSNEKIKEPTTKKTKEKPVKKAAEKALGSETKVDETARTVKLKNGLVVSMSYYLKNKAKLEV